MGRITLWFFGQGHLLTQQKGKGSNLVLQLGFGLNKAWTEWLMIIMLHDVWNGWESHGIFFGPLPCTLHVLADIILVEPEKDSDHQIKENIKTNLAISGTSGSSGFGSQRSEQIESSTWGPCAKFQQQKNHGRQCKASEYMPDIWIKTYLTLDTVSAGDHWDLSMSRQIAPLLKVIITKCEKVVFFGFTCWCLGGRFWLWMWILGAEIITKLG